MKDKDQRVEIIINKLKKTMNRSLLSNQYEKAMACVSVGCQILYEYNQYYTDVEFEDGVLAISQSMKTDLEQSLQNYHKETNTILFYDGFGLDTRGVAKMYLNALKKNNYKVIYVTGKGAEGKLPDTDKILLDADSETFFVDFKSKYLKWAKELINIFTLTKPKAMFFYTTPYDVSGAVAFATMEGLVDRYLIDLTDHAFWLGTKCNDYFCGSREMSASNQMYERGIAKDKLIKLGVNLIVDDGGSDHSGLPFDIKTARYVFSGGALYKTLGDPENTYYRIVDHILDNNKDIFFLYAGDGDRSEMDKILAKYPKRAFLISERKDFYYLIQNCTLYLNTYPMFGGMMMKYSANAGKIPITLKHENDSDGLLLDQPARRIEYDSFETLVSDVDKLLSDDNYLTEREDLLKGSVISEERFIKNVRMTIETQHTDYEHGEERIDTTKFKKEFYDRFDLKEAKRKVSKMINSSLFFAFPWMLIDAVKNKAKTLANK